MTTSRSVFELLSLNDQRRMYADLAWTWQIISPPEEYVEEAEGFRQAIDAYAPRPVRSLLDLGCGAGHNDLTLKKYFQVTGVDLSPSMLELAGRLNPEVTYQPGDMRSIRLGRRFDAVVIADSIDYMLNEADLRAAFQTALAHLEPGGIFCTYAEMTPERFQQKDTYCSTSTKGDIEITFVHSFYDPDASDTTYETTFVYLIRCGGCLEIQTDRHLAGIFPLETWRRLLAETGFDVKLILTYEQDPLFVCIKPADARAQR